MRAPPRANAKPMAADDKWGKSSKQQPPVDEVRPSELTLRTKNKHFVLGATKAQVSQKSTLVT